MDVVSLKSPSSSGILGARELVVDPGKDDGGLRTSSNSATDPSPCFCKHLPMCRARGQDPRHPWGRHRSCLAGAAVRTGAKCLSTGHRALQPLHSFHLLAPQAGTGVGAHGPENPHLPGINPNAEGDPSRGSTRPPAWNRQASFCLRPEAGRTDFTEPVALDSILETSTAFWLCNVHSQPWPVALGCLSLVMRPAYVFRRPWGETRGRRWGASKSNNSPPHPQTPLCTAGSGGPWHTSPRCVCHPLCGQQRAARGGACRQQFWGWLGFCYLQGLETRVTSVSHSPCAGARPSASEHNTPNPHLRAGGHWHCIPHVPPRFRVSGCWA